MKDEGGGGMGLNPNLTIKYLLRKKNVIIPLTLSNSSSIVMRPPLPENSFGYCANYFYKKKAWLLIFSVPIANKKYVRHKKD